MWAWLRAAPFVAVVGNLLLVPATGTALAQDATLTARPSATTPGQPVAAIWSGLPATGSHHIRLQRTAAPDGEYVEERTVTGANGSVQFAAPSAPGGYQFRLYRGAGRVVTSAPFQVMPAATPTVVPKPPVLPAATPTRIEADLATPGAGARTATPAPSTPAPPTAAVALTTPPATPVPPTPGGPVSVPPTGTAATGKPTAPTATPAAPVATAVPPTAGTTREPAEPTSVAASTAHPTQPPTPTGGPAPAGAKPGIAPGVEGIFAYLTRPGRVLYHGPTEMTQGEPGIAIVRVARDEAIDITRGVGTGGQTSVSEVDVAEEMRVRLDGGDDFKVRDLHSDPTQYVPPTAFSEWTWEVTPLKFGELELGIVVEVVVRRRDGNPGPAHSRPVDRRTIKVAVNPVWSAGEFVKSYWQWLATTLILPLALWGKKRFFGGPPAAKDDDTGKPRRKGGRGSR